MKHPLLTLTVVIIVFGTWFMWREVRYATSPQGKLEEILSEKRNDFTMAEILDGDWKAACLIPAGYHYLNREDFRLWLSQNLGREVKEGEYIDMQRDGSGAKILMNPPLTSSGMSSISWGIYKNKKSICFQNKETPILVRYSLDGPELDYEKAQVFTF